MSQTPGTILVVEDERPLLEAIKLKLEKNGFEVVSARSVEQAVHYLEDIQNVVAIWLDHYLLGTENGLDLVAKLKDEHSKWKHVSIFVVSNSASEDTVRSYLHLGIEKYFVKVNFRLDDIITHIKEHLQNESIK